MSDEKIGLDLEIKLQNAQSVKDLRQVLKEARDAAVSMKEGSAEYQKFMRIAGQAKDAIGDMNERIKALDPEEKAKAFRALGSTMIGGFQAATGAVAVFAGGNEDLNKILLKSMAVVQGLQGLQAIADAKKQLGTIKTILGLKSQAAAQAELNAVQGEGQAGALMKAEVGFGGLKKAIIATGIGALVVLLGTIIANWDSISKAIVNTFPALGKLGDYIDKAKAAISGLVAGFKAAFQNIGKALADLFSGHFKQALADITDFQAVSTAIINGYNEKIEDLAKEKRDKLLAIQIDESKRKLDVLQAEGKDTYALKKKILQDELSLLKQDTEEEKKAYKDKLNEIKVLDAEHKKELLDKQKEYGDKRQDILNQQRQHDLEDAKKALDIMTKEADARIKLLEHDQDIQKQLDDLLREGIKDARQKELADTAADYQDKLSQITGYSQKENELRQQLLINQREALKSINQKYDEADRTAANERIKKEIENETKIRDAKISIADSMVKGLTVFGNILTENGKKNQGIQKALALAQIGVNEAQAISGLLASSFNPNSPDNLFTGGLAGIAHFATGMVTILSGIGEAYSILGESPTDSTSSSPGASSITSVGQAPNLNASTPQTLLKGQSDTEYQNIRAYVLEHDITDSQRRTEYLRQKATH